MIVKPISLGKDLHWQSAELDDSRLVSIINTNTAAIKVQINGSNNSEVHMAAGERLSIEKEIGTNLVVNLATGGAISTSTVFGSQIAFTN